jgi:hypothetical protein
MVKENVLIFENWEITVLLFLQQEPGANGTEILNTLKYVRPGEGFEPAFPLTKKTDVNGENEDPLYTYLKVIVFFFFRTNPTLLIANVTTYFVLNYEVHFPLYSAGANEWGAQGVSHPSRGLYKTMFWPSLPLLFWANIYKNLNLLHGSQHYQ